MLFLFLPQVKFHASLSLSVTAFVTVHQHKIVAHQLCDRYCNASTAAYEEEFKNKFDVPMKRGYVSAVLLLSAARTSGADFKLPRTLSETSFLS
jgi:hypothetical protein